MTNDAESAGQLKDRIKELNDKASQLLLFFSFAIVGAATLNSQAARAAMRSWVGAVFIVLVALLPLKEIPFGTLPCPVLLDTTVQGRSVVGGYFF